MMWGWGECIDHDYRAAALAQFRAQQEWLEYHTPKGALWFWEHIPNPYLGG